MGTPTERASYHHGDLRNALVEASARLIARDGVEAFSLREAAREVGVSANAAYRHFEHKDALVAAVAADGFARMARHMEKASAVARAAASRATTARAAARERAIAVFLAIGEAYVHFAVGHPAHFRVMFGPWIEACDGQMGVGDTGKDPYQLLVDSLDALVAAGVIPPASREGAELVAWPMVHGLASLLVEGSLPPEARAALPRLGEVMLAGLGATASSPAVKLDPREAKKKKP